MADFRDCSFAPVPEVFLSSPASRASEGKSIAPATRPHPIVQRAVVTANVPLCREHYRISFVVPGFPEAKPGQFVHLSPDQNRAAACEFGETTGCATSSTWVGSVAAPMLRRAFSIAGLRGVPEGHEIDVIYRVVGTATRWLATLRSGDALSVLGPLGNAFPIRHDKPHAWLVAGGVGLPPMLWLAEAIATPSPSQGEGWGEGVVPRVSSTPGATGGAGDSALSAGAPSPSQGEGRVRVNTGARPNVIAFCGARSADLLPLSINPTIPPAADASRAAMSAREFAARGTGVVISTDDGSLGFHGRIGDALAAYHRHHPVPAGEITVYTCGPEPMMRAVAGYCLARGIECFVCMERNMACGTGLCQSCVVPVHDSSDRDGWRYRLCCTDGPIFPAADVIWDSPAGRTLPARESIHAITQ